MLLKNKKIDKRFKYIGNSLSFCVKDILLGYIPLKCVEGINSSTRITSFDDLKNVVKKYKESYWYEFKDDDIYRVLNYIIFRTKFYQVRLKSNKNRTINRKNIWIKARKNKS